MRQSFFLIFYHDCQALTFFFFLFLKQVQDLTNLLLFKFQREINAPLISWWLNQYPMHGKDKLSQGDPLSKLPLCHLSYAFPLRTPIFHLPLLITVFRKTIRTTRSWPTFFCSPHRFSYSPIQNILISTMARHWACLGHKNKTAHSSPGAPRSSGTRVKKLYCTQNRDTGGVHTCGKRREETHRSDWRRNPKWAATASVSKNLRNFPPLREQGIRIQNLRYSNLWLLKY